jgi:hypothetical protein
VIRQHKSLMSLEPRIEKMTALAVNAKGPTSGRLIGDASTG